jgi:helix-hairpin-helix protein
MASSLQAAPNDLDTIASSGVLLVDVNEVSAEQIRDIFELREELAQSIVDYRTESMRIFTFEELSKVQGLDEGTIQRLISTDEVADANAELQQALGLPTDRNVPLQEMLEAAMKDAKLEGLALVTPLGLWVAGYLTDDLAHDHFLEQIPLTLHDLGTDLSKLKLAETQSISVSSEEYDLLIQRAGVLFMVAIQPPDSFEAEVHEKLEKVRREIVRRYRPRLHLYHHAEKTPDDIIFDCPKCDLRIVIHHTAKNFEIDCPRCKTALIVPNKTLVQI